MPNEIRVLPEAVADKIAAGEVAERPSAVVKELTENAIDAGATKITVEIKNGGVKLIRVTDNGSGIPRGQVKTAFLRHATSKLRSEDDLYNISTMGFRGEALSSICAVARVEVITRTADDELGAHYVVDHGVCGEADEIACATGTIMSVEDLFANVPARMKFLKKDSTEAGYVSDLMTRLALSKPGIAFEYICDGKTIFVTNGDGDLKNVILKVYGLKFAKAVMPVDYTESGVKITGAAGRPEELSFGNRTKQTVLVNGRYIKNHVISKIAEEAFRNALMTGRFPFFVLNIEMSPEMVDVNVHPAKTEVKFANEKALYDIIYHALKNALCGTVPSAKPEQSGKKPAAVRDNAPRGKIDEGKIDKKVIRDYLEYTKPLSKSPASVGIPASGEGGAYSGVAPLPHKASFAGTRGAESSPPTASEEPYVYAVGADDHGRPQKPDQEAEPHPSTEEQPPKDEQISFAEFGIDEAHSDDIFADAKIVGQVFDTYIILSTRDTMYMIDQHAAHERAGFEELKEQYEKNARMSQMLLSPIVVNLTHSEHTAVLENLDTFSRFGFEIADFGGTSVVINETPLIASDEDIKSLLYEILNAVQDNIRHPIADFEEKALDMISCKKAIKANDRLSLPEMSKVVELVSELYKKGIKTCPHGRPIVTRFTKTEIEKMFKRII